jgi:hypothetical protein
VSVDWLHFPGWRHRETFLLCRVLGACCLFATASRADAISASMTERLFLYCWQCVAKAQVKLYRQWHVREQQRTDGQASRDLFHRSAGSDSTMPGRNLQLQPEQARDMFASWRSGKVPLNLSKNFCVGNNLTHNCQNRLPIA